MIAHKLTVTNFREIFNDHISAHILAFVLAFARGLHVYIPQQLRRVWAKPPEDEGVVPLPGSTALIVGLGGIGERNRPPAHRRSGMRVLAVDARRPDKPDHRRRNAQKPEALDSLLPRADFVILTVPHTPATEGFFNRTKFRLMKPSAFFINMGAARPDDQAGRPRRRAESRRHRRRRPRCL